MITLITVNFNNANATLRLLRALEQQSEREFDIIVVDNDSTDDDRAALGAYAAQSPLRLDIIYSAWNRGFSGGNNLAIRKALAHGSDWLLLINNDTTVSPDFIERLVAQLPAAPCIAGIPLHEGEHTAFAGIVCWLHPTLPHQYTLQHRDALRYAIGAGMLVHRSVFESVGLLDEAYFLYFEDADFSLRAQRFGIPVVFLSDPVILHRPSESTSKLGHPLLVRYHARNALRFNWRNGPWWVRALVPFAVGYGIAYETLKLLVGRHPTESRATRAGIMDFICGRWGRIGTEASIAVECESLEDTSWGVARMIRGALGEIAAHPDEYSQYRFDLYFKSRVPDEPWLQSPLFRTHVVRAPRWLPVPLSFSLYYYLLLPLRLWVDRPALTYWPNYMLPLIAPRPSLVMLTEDVWHEARNPHRALRYRLGYRIFATWAARSASCIMAISHASKVRIANLFKVSEERIAVNELAVDASSHTVEPMPGPYLLFVGQALERRHLRETIEAFERVAPQRPTLRLVAIGPDKYDTPIIDHMVTEANERLRRPAIQHLVWVSGADLLRFYAGAAAIVYVSDVEAFGLPPLEALSYGVPPIVREDPLNREIYGEHAFYARTGSTDDITEAMLRALDDHAHRARITAAAPIIVARYTWKAHADRLRTIIERLIRRP